MAYDPLAYVDQTGAMVSQVGRNVAGGLGNFFQQNAQWKQFKSNQKSDLDAKQKVYNTALSLMQERGINPSSFALPDPTDKRITPEDYIATFAEKIKGAFIGKGSKLTSQDAQAINVASQPGVASNVANQIALDTVDPTGQIDLGNKPSINVDPLTGQRYPQSNMNEQVSPGLLDALGAPAQTPAPKNDDDLLREAKQLAIANERKKIESGVGSGKELFDTLAAHDSLKLQHGLQKLKNEQEAIRLKITETKASKEKQGGEIYASQRAGFTVTDAAGNENVKADVYTNPENYTVSGDNPYKRTTWPAGKPTGGASKADRMKDIDTRINMLTNDTKQMLDSNGYPLQGMEAQYTTNTKQLKAAQLAKNFIQSRGGEAGLTADEAIQEVSTLQSLKDALELYTPTVPMAQYGVKQNTEQILQEGSRYFNTLPKEAYEKLRLSLERGGSPASILESLRRAGL